MKFDEAIEVVRKSKGMGFSSSFGPEQNTVVQIVLPDGIDPYEFEDAVRTISQSKATD